MYKMYIKKNIYKIYLDYTQLISKSSQGWHQPPSCDCKDPETSVVLVTVTELGHTWHRGNLWRGGGNPLKGRLFHRITPLEGRMALDRGVTIAAASL